MKKGFGKGSKQSEKAKKQISKALMGYRVLMETRRKISEANKGRKITKQQKQKISQALKKRKRRLGYINSTEARIKMKLAAIGKHPSQETRKKLRISHLGNKQSIETRLKIGDASKEHWQNSDYIKKIIKSRHTKPNKKELILYFILQKLLPKEYALNVKAEIMTLGGKVPDFVNINGQKKLIELFGNYFHNLNYFPNKETPLERKSFFQQFGWIALIIWERELEDIPLLKEKILQFNKE